MDNPNVLSDAEYRAVLANLKIIQANGLFGADEIHYVFKWDESKNREENIRLVAREDAAVRYFLETGIIIGERVENEFRRQELQARGPSGMRPGVWSKDTWDAADMARKEYEWEVFIWGIDAKKLDIAGHKFGLVDIGARLVERSEIPEKELFGLPPTKLRINDDFILHAQNVISYRGRAISLEPQARKIAAVIMERSAQGLYTDSEYLIDNTLSDEYLERIAKQDDNPASKYIQRYTSGLRSKFRTITHSEKEKDFFPHRVGLGYKFSP